jgi:hypothetical protein
MTRDPSDGTVRAVQATSGVAGAPIDHPDSPLVAAIKAGKVKPERLSEHWVFQRGWNEGIEFALMQIRKSELRSPEQGEI